MSRHYLKNLITTSDSKDPKDFYSFLLHRIIKKFEQKVCGNEDIDEKTKGSYKRLSEFVVSRFRFQTIWAKRNWILSSN